MMKIKQVDKIPKQLEQYKPVNNEDSASPNITKAGMWNGDWQAYSYQ